MALLAVFGLLAGCSPAGLLVSAVGVATDTSVTWEIVKHVHARMTDGDPAPCFRLDSVERALNPRCGPYLPGSLQARDLAATRLQGCLLEVAVRDPRLWPTLPDLIDIGASPAACSESPLQALAQLPGCPDFALAAPEVRAVFRTLAASDPRAVQHDVMRMLSCPGAVAAGLDSVFDSWLASGALDVGKVGFGPLGALSPGYLASPFARRLEARGHGARGGLDGYDGVQPRGFEVALRDSDFVALDWWIARVPELVDQVPPARGDQLPWRPLARVLLPGFLKQPDQQAATVRYLMARGADPWRKLPYDAGSSIVQYARTLHSPMLALLDPSSSGPPPPTVFAATVGDPAGR